MDLQVTEFSTIIELLKAFPDEQSCINHLEALRWNGVVISPFDETSKVYKCKGNKYKCKNTNKYFNVRTGTILEDTKVPLQKWFDEWYAYNELHKKFEHGVVKHGAKEYVNGLAYTNGVENFWSHMKRGISLYHIFIFSFQPIGQSGNLC